MKKWETNAVQGLIVGIGLMIAVIFVDVGVVWLAASRPLTIGTFILGLSVLFSLGLLGLIGYWLYGLARSEYFLDRNALVIHWGPTEQTIPAGQIELVLTGEEVEGHIRFYGGMWPGHCVGYGEVPGAGPTLFYATVPPRRQIYVVTPSLTYGVSPADRDGFLESFQRRLQMGPTQIVEQSSKRPSFLDWTIWQDRLGLALLSASFLAVLALTSLLCFQFHALPWLVPLHFDAAGRSDRLAPRVQVFIIPLIGLLTFLLNGVLGWLAYRRERVASYLLWGGAVLIQLLVLTATIGMLGQFQENPPWLSARHTMLGSLDLFELLGGFALSLVIGVIGYRRGALSGSGVVGALITGTLIFGLGGWEWGVLLVAFFVSSSALSFYHAREKQGLAEKFAKGHRRDLGQALANGGLTALLAVLSKLLPLVGGGREEVWFAACAGAMAAVTADTWATELGVLSSHPPRLITTGRRVEVGTSGGVTWLGTAASLGGAFFIGLWGGLGLLVLRQGWVSAAVLLLAATVSGMAGSLFDSLLGATVQAIYWCDACGKKTERRLHRCGTETRLLRGWRWLGNDLVNFIASAVGALVAAGVGWVLL